MRVEKLKAAQLQSLLDRKAKSYVGPVLTEEQIDSLENSKHSYSAFLGEKLLMCGGVSEYWNGRGEAWVVLDPEHKCHFASVLRCAKRFLEFCPVSRIEAAVDVDFKQGHRFVKVLGFSKDVERLECFLPDGKDVSLYSIVKRAA